ncbi:hypothetical protein D3C80_1849550 [compost metagenome]
MAEGRQRADKGGHLLPHMHAGLVAHLPALSRQSGRQPGLVIGLRQPLGITGIQIDEVDVVEGGRLGLVVQVIPNEISHKPGTQRPVGQGQIPRRPQTGHAC